MTPNWWVAKVTPVLLVAVSSVTLLKVAVLLVIVSV